MKRFCTSKTAQRIGESCQVFGIASRRQIDIECRADWCSVRERGHGADHDVSDIVSVESFDDPLGVEVGTRAR